MPYPRVLSHRALLNSRTERDYEERQRWRTSDLGYFRYVRPVTKTLHRIQSLCDSDQDFVATTLVNGVTFAPGTLVPVVNSSGTPGHMIAGSPPPTGRGSSAAPIATSYSSPVASHGVQSATPEELYPDTTDNDVEVTGYGFLDGDQFVAVKYNPTTAKWVEDMLATVTSATVTSDTTADLVVDVDAAAPIGYRLNIWPGRPGQEVGT